MINMTQVCSDLVNKTSEEAFKRVGEIYFAPFLIFWLVTLLLIVTIGIKTLSKDWDKFFLIFIIPFLITGALCILFTFILPILPKLLGGIFQGMLGS